MKRIGKICLLWTALLALLVVASSCNSMRKNMVYRLSLHYLTGEAENAMGTGYTMLLYGSDGTTSTTVRAIPLVSSVNITHAEILPTRDDRHCGIRLFFDREGASRWAQATGYMGGDPLAIVVDGMMAGTMLLPGHMSEQGYADLPPIWHRLEAEDIAAHAEKNYQKAPRHW